MGMGARILTWRRRRRWARRSSSGRQRHDEGGEIAGALGPTRLPEMVLTMLQIWASGEEEGGGRPPETRREPAVLASSVRREP